MKLNGTIKNVTYFNKENAFAILQLRVNNSNVTAKGVCPDMQVIDSVDKIRGLGCELDGNWIKHPKYGDQFDAKLIHLENSQGLVFFLTNVVKGLGSQLAKQLIKEYGEKELTDILDNNPDQLLEFKGIKEKKLKKVTETWSKYRVLKRLTDFFVAQDVAVTSNLMLRIYNHFKEQEKDPVTLIQENPYCLTDIRGIGFKTADKLALQLGIEEYAPNRIKALIDYILLSQASDSGHTYLLYKDLWNLILENISDIESLDDNLLSQTIQSVLTGYDDYYTDNDGRIALKAYKYKEDWIYNFFLKKAESKNSYVADERKIEKFISDKENQLHIELGEKQRQAILSIAKGYNIFLLCGYAGTGKSTISKLILDFYKENFTDSIVTCAFTGMASKRIAEVTGYRASTIHSLLGFKGEGFEYNASNKLPYKVILIDEASMINIGLFYSLLKAVADDTVIILVGDDAQLPPIGEGNVFSDLVYKDWMPKTKLDVIYRQSEDSVLTVFANDIRQGQLPAKNSVNYSDFAYIIKNKQRTDKMTDKEAKEVRDAFYKELQESFLELIQHTIQNQWLKGVKKIWDVQVVSAMHNTPLGTKDLNTVLQNELNDIYKQKVVIRGSVLKQHDKVIHLKNQNMKVVTQREYQSADLAELYDSCDTTKRIYNGNLGLVLDIDEPNEMFSVVYPEPNGSNTIALYSFDDYRNIIDLGYALTVHKTQGNQFAYVFIPLINGFYMMLNNKLLYTAITRARKKVYLMGESYAFKRGCTNIDETQRNTFVKLYE